MRVLSLQRSTQRKESGIIILGKSGLVRSVPSDIKIVTMSLTTSKLSGWNAGIWFYLLHWETFQVLLVLLWEYKAFVPFTSVDSSSVYGRWWRWDSGKSSDHRGPACKGDVGAPLPSFLSSWTWVDELCSALSGWALLCTVTCCLATGPPKAKVPDNHGREAPQLSHNGCTVSWSP